MNQAQFIGNLTADAVARTSRDGQSQYVTFTLAVSQRQPDGTQQTTYVECSKNGDNARLLPFLTKGKRIWAQGRISAHAYTDRQGQPRASIDLRVRDLELCGERQAEQSSEQAAQTATAPQQPQAVTPEHPFSRTPRQDGNLFPDGALTPAPQPSNPMQHETDLPF